VFGAKGVDFDNFCCSLICRCAEKHFALRSAYKTVSPELLVQLTEGTLSYFSENRSRCSIEELIRNVTSKGGTTEAGLNYYYEHHIDQLIEGVLEAAKNRSIEMSKNELN
jgi:pyrroline-5-carboxylate reductase